MMALDVHISRSKTTTAALLRSAMGSPDHFDTEKYPLTDLDTRSAAPVGALGGSTGGGKVKGKGKGRRAANGSFSGAPPAEVAGASGAGSTAAGAGGVGALGLDDVHISGRVGCRAKYMGTYEFEGTVVNSKPLYTKKVPTLVPHRTILAPAPSRNLRVHHSSRERARVRARVMCSTAARMGRGCSETTPTTKVRGTSSPPHSSLVK